jgi:hypothetical protein
VADIEAAYRASFSLIRTAGVAAILTYLGAGVLIPGVSVPGRVYKDRAYIPSFQAWDISP